MLMIEKLYVHITIKVKLTLRFEATPRCLKCINGLGWIIAKHVCHIRALAGAGQARSNEQACLQLFSGRHFVMEFNRLSEASANPPRLLCRHAHNAQQSPLVANLWGRLVTPRSDDEEAPTAAAAMAGHVGAGDGVCSTDQATRADREFKDPLRWKQRLATAAGNRSTLELHLSHQDAWRRSGYRAGGGRAERQACTADKIRAGCYARVIHTPRTACCAGTFTKLRSDMFACIFPPTSLQSVSRKMLIPSP